MWLRTHSSFSLLPLAIAGFILAIHSLSHVLSPTVCEQTMFCALFDQLCVQRSGYLSPSLITRDLWSVALYHCSFSCSESRVCPPTISLSTSSLPLTLLMWQKVPYALHVSTTLILRSRAWEMKTRLLRLYIIHDTWTFTMAQWYWIHNSISWPFRPNKASFYQWMETQYMYVVAHFKLANIILIIPMYAVQPVSQSAALP